jgi:hypothetical protein
MKSNKEDRYERERSRARWVGHILTGVSTLGLMGIYTYMLLVIADKQDRIEALERGCPNPVVEMEEYRGVVHALDRCYQRLDEEQQNVLGMRSELDHCGYVERITHLEHPDAEINCQGLLNRALQDVWFDAESALYDCYEVKRNECWCPFEEEDP